MEGMIVRALKGRDKGKYMVIVKALDGAFLVCDGKERRLQKPKLKNPKHILPTNHRLDVIQYSSDSRLRRALFEYSAAAVTEEEEIQCQKRI